MINATNSTSAAVSLSSVYNTLLIIAVISAIILILVFIGAVFLFRFLKNKTMEFDVDMRVLDEKRSQLILDFLKTKKKGASLKDIGYSLLIDEEILKGLIKKLLAEKRLKIKKTKGRELYLLNNH